MFERQPRERFNVQPRQPSHRALAGPAPYAAHSVKGASVGSTAPVRTPNGRPQGVRPVLVLLHRYVGLVLALFLLISGLTGAVLVWYDELDATVNASMMKITPPATGLKPLDPLVLRERVTAAFPQAWVDSVRLKAAPSRSQMFGLSPALGPGGQPTPALAHDEVYVHPYTGEILGMRKWGDLGQGPTNLLPFLYRLHFSLALGTIGTWAFGIVAVLWVLDCFVGAWLTFPASARPRKSLPRFEAAPRPQWLARWWRTAWQVRWGGGAFKLNHDLHRAGGLWPWALLLVVAWSSVAFNLYKEVYRPVMSTVLPFQADVRGRLPKVDVPTADPALGWAGAQASARQHLDALAQAKGFTIVEDSYLRHLPQFGALRFGVRTDRDLGHSSHGQTWVIVDARTGALLGSHIPTGETSGDTLTRWLMTLHMGHLWGLPYRVLLTAVGLGVAMLSVTGVWIWWKKRQARCLAAARQPQRAAAPTPGIRPNTPPRWAPPFFFRKKAST
ncbi:MAG: PepSY-associated TM helix domain-containing protein [Pseudomonadota bacterium]